QAHVLERAPAPPRHDDLPDARLCDVAHLRPEHLRVAARVRATSRVVVRREVERRPTAVLLPVQVRAVAGGAPVPWVVEDRRRGTGRGRPGCEEAEEREEDEGSETGHATERFGAGAAHPLTAGGRLPAPNEGSTPLPARTMRGTAARSVGGHAEHELRRYARDRTDDPS